MSKFSSHHIFSFTFPVNFSSCLTSFFSRLYLTEFQQLLSLAQPYLWNEKRKDFFFVVEKIQIIFMCLWWKIWMKVVKMSFFRAFEGSKYKNWEILTNTNAYLLSGTLSLENCIFLWEKPVECAEKLLLLFTIKDELFLLLFLLLLSYHHSWIFFFFRTYVHHFILNIPRRLSLLHIFFFFLFLVVFFYAIMK